MKKRAAVIFFVIIAVLGIGITACKKKEKVHTNNGIILNGSAPGLNTCGWIIKINEGAANTDPQNSFKPINLAQQHKINRLRVTITYTIPDLPPIKCDDDPTDLPGYTQINILSIQQLN